MAAYVTDYTESSKFDIEIIEDASAFLGGPGTYEYDFGYFTYLEMNVHCKKCGELLGFARIHGMDQSLDISGPEIDVDTVCPKCGASLYDEKAIRKIE